ncbi:hypothetical protein TrVE_jg10853 [Triparma verrucosa]|uniref:Uncharacterized protein n=1 Tax=Triparma verrucosa TaxID=1606542 RepID=A0A9W7BUE2_9STRA|nr:hypothetical protein TrVE_jg10853 [Triparma verrucosa]
MQDKTDISFRDMLIPGNASASSLVEQMDRKENLFSQIGDYISKVQAETGNNAQHVKKKLLELEDVREELSLKDSKLNELSRRMNQTEADLAQTRSYNESLVSDIEKLNAVVVAEKNLTQRQTIELSRWQDTVEALRHDNTRLEGSVSKADLLQHANVELNEELNRVRSQIDDERVELRKTVNSLSSQLEASVKKESETSSHFWNLTEDAKNLRSNLERITSERDVTSEKLDEVTRAHRSLKEMSEAREDSLKADLERVKGSIDQALMQASNQKEIQMRNEFKDMLERMGGLQEQAEMHRGELEGLEKERDGYRKKLGEQKGETEKVMNLLREERKKSDSAALEIATLQQNMNSMESQNKKAAGAIGQGQDEIARLQDEVGKLKADLQIAKNQREEDAQLVAVAMSERDGILNRYKSDTEQHRLTVESLRKSEQNAAGNVQHMAAELENMKAQNEGLQKQVMSGSHHTNAELQNYKAVCDQLQKELEVRLEQLAQETERADENAREASAIRNEVKAKAEELQEREKSWSRSYTKEKERLQSEYATIKMRCTNLEQEKADLLKEGEELNKETKESRKEKEDALDKVRELEKEKGELDRLVVKTKGEKIELLEELKAVNRREEETQNNVARREQDLLQELDDVKHELKNTKKVATGQVMEFQGQTEALMKQMMKIQGELAGTAANLAEKTRNLEDQEIQNAELKGRIEEIQAGYMNELAEKRREIERFKGSALMAAQEARKKGEELDASKIELARVGGDSRSLRDGKRDAESRAREAERQLRHLEEDLAKAQDDVNRFRGKAVELEDELGKLQLNLREVQILNVDLKEKGTKEMGTLKNELEKLNDIVRSQEEALEGSRRLVAEGQTKFGQLQATSNATINGLMAELKATEEALVRERERMSHDTEVLRSQVVETERDMDSNISKYKTTITALREESDRYRRAAYTLEAETNKLKVQLEGKKREVDRLAAEMEVAKDANRDSERRLAMQKDSVRAAERELERIRDTMRDYESNKSANDEQLGAANIALKSTVVSKDETIRKLERRLQWESEENATKVSLLNKEKEGLLQELGLQTGDGGSPARGGGRDSKKNSSDRGNNSNSTSPKHITQATANHAKKKEQMERRASMKQKKEKAAVPNWSGLQDDLAEEANWPPGGGGGGGGGKPFTDSGGRLPEPSDESIDSEASRWETANPVSTTGNFYKEEEGSAGSVINRAADFLAKRRQKEATKVATQAHENDQRHANTGNLGGAADTIGEDDEYVMDRAGGGASMNMLMSQSTPSMAQYDDGYTETKEGRGRDTLRRAQQLASLNKTKFPPL